MQLCKLVVPNIEESLISKNLRYQSSNSYIDIEESSISKLKFGPCSPGLCRIADRDCWLQFSTQHILHCNYFISGECLSLGCGSRRPGLQALGRALQAGPGAPPRLQYCSGSGGPEAGPSSPWFHIGYYAFIHLQINTRRTLCP